MVADLLVAVSRMGAGESVRHMLAIHTAGQGALRVSRFQRLAWNREFPANSASYGTGWVEARWVFRRPVMATPEQNNTRSAEADTHPTPASSYFALLIMAAIAVGMLALQLTGPGPL